MEEFSDARPPIVEGAPEYFIDFLHFSSVGIVSLSTEA
jgi:hypothetical protein